MLSGQQQVTRPEFYDQSLASCSRLGLCVISFLWLSTLSLDEMKKTKAKSHQQQTQEDGKRKSILREHNHKEWIYFVSMRARRRTAFKKRKSSYEILMSIFPVARRGFICDIDMALSWLVRKLVNWIKRRGLQTSANNKKVNEFVVSGQGRRCGYKYFTQNVTIWKLSLTS